jgi:hypothetical protein
MADKGAPCDMAGSPVSERCIGDCKIFILPAIESADAYPSNHESDYCLGWVHSSLTSRDLMPPKGAVRSPRSTSTRG